MYSYLFASWHTVDVFLTKHLSVPIAIKSLQLKYQQTLLYWLIESKLFKKSKCPNYTDI